MTSLRCTTNLATRTATTLNIGVIDAPLIITNGAHLGIAFSDFGLNGFQNAKFDQGGEVAFLLCSRDIDRSPHESMKSTTQLLQTMRAADKEATDQPREVEDGQDYIAVDQT